MCNQCVEVEVYLHLILGNVTDYGVIIPHPTDTVTRLLTTDAVISPDEFSSEADIRALFEANIAIANEAFQGTPFRFRFVQEDTTQTISNDWSNNAADFQADMSAELGSGDLTKMHVFLAWSLRQLEFGVILGIASLPAAQIAIDGDGMIMRYDVLPNGGRTSSDLGFTFVHEIGHWLGLLHTFQTLVSTSESCDAREEELGDLVDDTPVQAGPSTRLVESCREYLGNEQPPDTCPNLPGRDAIHNYMNYVDDEQCQLERGEFSCGQIERMYRHWLLFREHVTSCGINEMEIEIVVGVDQSYVSETTFVLTNEVGEVFVDSFVDHRVALFIFEQDTLLIDLCVPRSGIYTFDLQDRDGDGFSDGYIEIYVDRRLVELITGDFGSSVSVDITEDLATLSQQPSSSPTQAPSASSMPSLHPSSVPTSFPTNSASPTELPVVPVEAPVRQGDTLDGDCLGTEEGCGGGATSHASAGPTILTACYIMMVGLFFVS